MRSSVLWLRERGIILGAGAVLYRSNSCITLHAVGATHDPRRIAFGNWLTRGLSLARFGRDRFYPLAFETPTGRPPWISLSRAGRVLRTREPETPRCMISTSF